MTKYLIFIINLAGVLLFRYFLGTVDVSIQAPEEVAPGDEFLVEITISKDSLESFARLQQELPIGFTAISENSANGDFTFKDQKIKIIWLKLPADKEFVVSYKIKVDPTATGQLQLGGAFSYIEENERKTIDIPSKTVIIRGSGENLLTDNNTNDNTSDNQDQNNSNTDSTNNQNTVQDNTTNNSNENYQAQYIPPDPEKVFCFRETTKDGNDIIVHLLINKGNLEKDKFAKIQENIPDGYMAYNIESHDGIFSFKDNSVKFLWMTLPTETQFRISYKLTPVTTSNLSPTISGSFSYIENDATKVISIENKAFLGSQPLLVDNTQDNNSNSNNNTTNTNNTNDTNNSNNTTYNSNTSTDITNIPNPETGISYRVQIAAGHVPVNARSYFKKFNIAEPVQTELHEGWHKYTIGTFTVYKEARDRRVQVWNTTPINDAFVSAYNNGTRITVQEALMIANQKWYQ